MIFLSQRVKYNRNMEWILYDSSNRSQEDLPRFLWRTQSQQMVTIGHLFTSFLGLIVCTRFVKLVDDFGGSSAGSWSSGNDRLLVWRKIYIKAGLITSSFSAWFPNSNRFFSEKNDHKSKIDLFTEKWRFFKSSNLTIEQ